jgi:hypothetical protein
VEHPKSEIDLLEFLSGKKRLSESGQQGRTPILHQPIFKDRLYRTKYTLHGLIRAFYIQILAHPQCIIKVIEIIEREYQYEDIEGLYLLPKYPDNQFIGDILLAFLKNASELKRYSELLDYLNKFQLYDEILVQLFINKLKVYMTIPTELDSEITKKCFFGLANVLELVFELQDYTAYFF